jgi:DNA-directed RNA polymerase subunit beta
LKLQRQASVGFFEEGLVEELDSFSPITDYTGKLELHLSVKNTS